MTKSHSPEIQQRIAALDKKYAGTTRGNLVYEGVTKVTQRKDGHPDFLVRVHCTHCGSALQMGVSTFRNRKKNVCECSTNVGLLTGKRTDLELIWPAVVKAGREVMNAYQATSAL